MRRDIVVVGASAGGLQALQQLAGWLPADFPAAVLVVLHLNPEVPSFLPDILTRAGALPAVAAANGEAITPGTIYVAPPDMHLLVERGRTRVVRGPRENRHRPAVDPLFRSAAWAYGPRVIGVVLSGSLDDGTAGLWAIKQCGGVAIVQDPEEARYPDMPRNALSGVAVDHSLTVSAIASLLIELTALEFEAGEVTPPATMKLEVDFAAMEGDMSAMNELGQLSPFTCPSCKGSLWELRDGELARYRCHTGHSYSEAALLGEQGTSIEDAIYSALRAVEEKAGALRRLGTYHADRSPSLTASYDRRAEELDRTAVVLREMAEVMAR